MHSKRSLPVKPQCCIKISRLNNYSGTITTDSKYWIPSRSRSLKSITAVRSTMNCNVCLKIFKYLLFSCYSQHKTVDVRRSIQPIQPDQLHCVLRRSNQRTHGRTGTEDVCSVWEHPRNTGIQGQGLRIRSVSTKNCRTVRKFDTVTYY